MQVPKLPVIMATEQPPSWCFVVFGKLLKIPSRPCVWMTVSWRSVFPQTERGLQIFSGVPVFKADCLICTAGTPARRKVSPVSGKRHGGSALLPESSGTGAQQQRGSTGGGRISLFHQFCWKMQHIHFLTSSFKFWHLYWFDLFQKKNATTLLEYERMADFSFDKRDFRKVIFAHLPDMQPLCASLTGKWCFSEKYLPYIIFLQDLCTTNMINTFIFKENMVVLIQVVYCMDRAIALAPTCQRFKILKAECLALLGRYPEAQSVARWEPW